MSASTPTTVFLGEFETKTLLEVESRLAGTTPVRMMVRGNAILSSVFVKSIAAGATLKINYFDTTSGSDGEGERFELNGHALITDTAAGQTFRILVPRIHNKPQLEAIVTGGAVEFGVYGSIVGDFPLSGNILDGQLANLLADGGLAPSVYDPTTGRFYLLRGSQGVLATGSALSTGKMARATIAAMNVEQSHTFPAATRLFLVKPAGPGKLLLSFDAGTSAADGLTISPGGFYRSPEFAAAAKTIYFQSPVAGLVVELESWS